MHPKEAIPWRVLQQWSAKKQKAYQATKLQEMLHYFALTPFYESLFQVHGIHPRRIKTTNDIMLLPFTTKQDLVATLEHPEKSAAFVANPTHQLHKIPALTTMKLFFSGNLKQQLAAEFKPVHVHFTTGRSAMSIPVFYTQYDLHQFTVSAKRMMDYLDIPHTVRVVNVFPYAPHLAFWHTFYATNALGIFGLHTGGGKIMGTQHIIESIERMRAEVIIGMPSYVYHLATTAATQRRDFSAVKYIILGGEGVTHSYIEKLKGFFGYCHAEQITVFTTYGFTEGKVAWTQCNEESGYHLYPDMEYIEIVDHEGKRVPDGESGEIVYTSLDFRGTIFLRYKTGDIGRLQTGSCLYCGARTPRLEPAITRSTEILPLQLTKVKGTLVDFNAVSALLSSLPFIDEWQLVISKKKQFGLDEVTLFVAPHPGEDFSYIKNELMREMRYRFNITPTIVRKSKHEIVEQLGLETHLKEKRIVDLREKAEITTEAHHPAAHHTKHKQYEDIFDEFKKKKE